MKKWKIVCSKDAINIDFETTILSESEPDFAWCSEIAQQHDCEHFDCYEIEEDANDK